MTTPIERQHALDDCCAGCSVLRQVVATLRAEFASHVEWAAKAERLTALEKRLEEYDRHSRELRVMDEQARNLAYGRMNERLESMNELRNQISVERGQFITRVEHVASVDRIGVLENWRSAQEATKATFQRASALVGAIAGAVSSFLATFLMNR